LWLQCDPTISARPATVKIAEADPSNPNVATTCKYYFEALVHKDFCPGGGGGSSGFDYGWVTFFFVCFFSSPFFFSSFLGLCHHCLGGSLIVLYHWNSGLEVWHAQRRP
jgi:hypothetical protein